MNAFILSFTGALPLRATAGQKNGSGALRTCKTDAPDASDDPMLIYIRVNVLGGGSSLNNTPQHLGFLRSRSAGLHPPVPALD